MERGLELAFEGPADIANAEEGNYTWLFTDFKVWLVSQVERNRMEPQSVSLTSVSEIPKHFPNFLPQPTFTLLLD
jgi:hypothetical protein